MYRTDWAVEVTGKTEAEIRDSATRLLADFLDGDETKELREAIDVEVTGGFQAYGADTMSYRAIASWRSPEIRSI